MSITHITLRELVAALGRAQRAFVAGNQDAARAAISEALALDPENVQARSLLARLDEPPADAPGPRRLHTRTPAAERQPRPHGVVDRGSWVAFEARVRERRAARLAAEAAAALHAGRDHETAALLAELRSLVPGDERIAALERTIAQGPATLEADGSDGEGSLVQESRLEHAPRRRVGARAVWIAAVVVLAAAIGGWTAHLQIATRGDDVAMETLGGRRLPAGVTGPLALDGRAPAPVAPPDEETGAAAASSSRASAQAARPPVVDMPAPPPSAPQADAAPERPVPARVAAGGTAIAPAARTADAAARTDVPREPDVPVPVEVREETPLLARAESPAPPLQSPPVAIERPPAAPDVPRASGGRDAPPAAAATTGAVRAIDPTLRPSPAPSAEAAARSVLDEYRAAYNTLDAGAAQRIWPSVDSRGLERAFRQLESQSLAFERCDVTATGAAGQAVCRGRARWAPAVGDRSPREEARTWRFTLSQRGTRWVITNVQVSRN